MIHAIISSIIAMTHRTTKIPIPVASFVVTNNWWAAICVEASAERNERDAIINNTKFNFREMVLFFSRSLFCSSSISISFFSKSSVDVLSPSFSPSFEFADTISLISFLIFGVNESLHMIMNESFTCFTIKIS